MVEIVVGIYGYDGNSIDGWIVIMLVNVGMSLMVFGQGFFVVVDVLDVEIYDLIFILLMMCMGDSDDFINGFGLVSILFYFKFQAFIDSCSYGISIYFNEVFFIGLDVGYDVVLWGDVILDFVVYIYLVLEDEGEFFVLQFLGIFDLDDFQLVILFGIEVVVGILLILVIIEEELFVGMEVYLLDFLNGECMLLSGLLYIFMLNVVLSGLGCYYLVFNEGQVVSILLEIDWGELSVLVIYVLQYWEELVIIGEFLGGVQLLFYDVQGCKLLGWILLVGVVQ